MNWKINRPIVRLRSMRRYSNQKNIAFRVLVWYNKGKEIIDKGERPMPTLDWIGKDKVINHHLEVPYRVLKRQYSFDEEGQKSEDNGSENMVIHGDNLSALKSLLPQYEGKIKCIYIDPPYNTGNEGWVYNDNVNDPQIKKWLGKVVGSESEDLSRHDKWLCMMYPRLKLLHRLLADDGVIFISIDDNEQANLKLICDEIFGKSNFVTNFHWRRTESQNNSTRLVSTVTDYILCYLKSKNRDSAFAKISLKKTAQKEYRYEDEKGFFRRGTIVDNTRGKNIIEVTSPNGVTKTIKSIRTKKFIEDAEKENLIYWTKSGTPYLKIYLANTEGQVTSNWLDTVGVNEDAKDMIKELGLDFDFSKPQKLIEYLISLYTGKNSIILDSFAGSGTTAHAVLNMNQKDGGNRKFILIEMCDYAESITAERVKRVIQGYGSGKKAVKGTGGNFSYYELGEKLLDGEYLNEAVPVSEIRQYVYFTETKERVKENSEEPYQLGVYLDTAYYFYYERDAITTLDRGFLHEIKTKANAYVIYADRCLLSDVELEKYHITFKKIPRDITRL